MKNKIYTRASKFCMWLILLFVLPNKIWMMREITPTITDLVEILAYIYIGAGNYILGYRLTNPPNWSKYIIPKNWVSEWLSLSNSEPNEVKSNMFRLNILIACVLLLTVIALAVAHGVI